MPKIKENLKVFQREWRFILATFSASGVGYMGSAAAPAIVGSLLEAGLNYEQAGDLGTIELLTLALTSSLVIPFVPRLSHRKLAVGGAMMAALGLIVSTLSGDYFFMVIGRLITGAGSGLAISGANAAVAAREDAERIFAIIWTMGGATTAALAAYLPGIAAGGNYPRGFGTMLLLCFLGIPLMLWIPTRPASLGRARASNSEGASVSASGAEPVTITSALRSVFQPLALMALAGMFIYSIAEQALWQFAYTLPVEAGLDEDLVASTLGGMTMIGLAGGAIAAWLGTRIGRIAPLVIGSLMSMMGRFMFIAASTTELLMLAGILWGLGFYFVSPYQIGLVAALDRQGRVAVAAGAVMNFGYAFGPGIAGRILQYYDTTVLVYVIAAATLVSMLLLLPLAVHVDRASKIGAA